MKPMPDKDPSFWALVLTALRENGLAMVLTFALTWFRIQYGRKQLPGASSLRQPSAH